MKSVILAGGFGTRIRPLTLSKPKPLVEFCNRPAIEYQFEACKNAGVNHIILAVSEYQNITEEVKKLGQKYSIRTDFSVESTPLGTAGSIRLAKDLICEEDDDCSEFITFNSDIICDYPLNELLESHHKNKAKVTILVTDVEEPKDFGVILYDEDNKIKSFIEKPKDLISNKINAGVYILSKEVLDHIPLKNYSIEKEFFPKFLKFGTTYAYHLDGFWSDIGKPNGYLDAQNLYLTNLNFLNNSNKKRKFQDDEYKLKLSKSNSLETLDNRGFLYTCCVETPMSSFESTCSDTNQSNVSESRFKGPVLIHSSSDIGDDCLIGPNVCVGPNVKIGNGCRILNSTLMEGVQIESNCYIEGSIIGWQSCVKRWTRIEGLTVLGKSVVVGESLFLRGSIVLPHKTISSSLYDSGQVII